MSDDEIEDFLHFGNQHLGNTFHTFSIPAKHTCPGATLACLLVCYAMGFVFLTRSSLAKHTRNWRRAEDTELFAREMYREVRYRRVKRLRIHVAGDFFNAAYVRAWIWVARRSKTTKFLVYTRSWRVPEMRDTLVELAKLPNVYAFWSEDRDSGPCDLPHGRRAFLCVNLQDELLVPPGVLVFREVTSTAKKFINGSWVCAKEQGTKTGITCSSCLRCVKRGPWPVAPGGRGRDGPEAEGTTPSG
jgi:Gene product 88